MRFCKSKSFKDRLLQSLRFLARRASWCVSSGVSMICQGDSIASGASCTPTCPAGFGATESKLE
eukprot:3438982-Amphidinium_carterae.1